MKITKLLFTLVGLAFFSTSAIYAQVQFEEVTGTPFEDVSYSSIAFADVNGNGHEDVLITGEYGFYQEIAKLYINDGNGNYTEDTSVSFDGVSKGSIAFADVDGDGDEDVLITGIYYDSFYMENYSTKLYINDGNGNFTEDTSVPFDGVGHSSIAFSDVDGDGDQDVLITGQNDSNQRIAKLYINNGDGDFMEDTSVDFEGVHRGSIAFSDVDGDGDEDVLITGTASAPSNLRIAKLYINDGDGVFTEDDTSVFEGVTQSSIAFSDVDGDGDKEILITGTTGSGPRITKFYTKDVDGNFTEDTSVPFDNVNNGSIAFADVDGDGDEDVLITGSGDASNSWQSISKLYINDGDGNFTEHTSVPFDGVRFSSIAFSDVDGDGDVDVLITGSSSSGRVTKLYRNITNRISWTGDISTDWSDVNNWDASQVPQLDNEAFIAESSSNYPTISATENIQVRNLNLEENTSLLVEGILKVNNAVLNDGQLTFKSTEDKTGQLDEFTGIFSGSGTVEVERYIPEGRRTFRLISPAVTTTTSIYVNWQENGASPSGFGTHITGVDGAVNGFDETLSNNPSLFSFDNSLEDQSGGAAWQAVGNTDENTLTAGTPYRLFVRGDRNIDLTSNESSANETVLRARGDLHLGDYSPNISDQDGNFNFVGNPYQAAVDFNALSFSGDINANYIYVWDAQFSEDGGFVTIETLTGDNTSGSNANQFIQPGQAFFVRNNLSVTTAPSITFTESAKRVEEEQLSTFSTLNYAKVNLQLFSNNQASNLVDAVGLRFSEDFQNEINDADAGKMGNSGENLALVNSNQLLSIEQRENPSFGEEIQLFINNFQAENYSFQLQLENWDEEDEIFIKDHYLDTLTQIDEDTNFSFSIDPSISESTSVLRFSLVFGNETLSNDEFEDASFSVYPNPTREQLFISGIDETMEVQVFDLLGTQVLSKNGVQHKEGINVQFLPSGVYLVKVNAGENSFTQKIIKK